MKCNKCGKELYEPDWDYDYMRDKDGNVLRHHDGNTTLANDYCESEKIEINTSD